MLRGKLYTPRVESLLRAISTPVSMPYSSLASIAREMLRGKSTELLGD